ncbi:RDD family protein [Kordia sp. SMS9]|uniref:RDD family protein n=1 Tax=Kordia sp. SMS9 TaxID=2282170 RepID=UPI000E1054A2|nr:RDD family protein [Kordia sp. SMS9]AXG70274.1 RDD family protein [Kordia sp. SMS9]
MKRKKDILKGIFIREISKITTTNFKLRRIQSMFLDHIIMSLILITPTVIFIFFGDFKSFDFINKHSTIIFSVLIFLCMNKDFLKAQSAAKRLLGYQVIDCKTKQPASELQCFLRNMSMIIWPLEVGIAYLNPSRRLGDIIANTEIISVDKEELSTIWKEIKQLRFTVEFVYILIIAIVYFYVLSFILF